MKSDIEIAVEGSRDIEQLLVKRLGAKGIGLVANLDSIDSSRIPKSLDFVVRQIAHARNKVVHVGGKLNNRKNFQKMVEAAIHDLKTIPASTSEAKKLKVEKKNKSTKSKGDKTVKPAVKTVEIVESESFDPFIVTIDSIGTFGSDIYKRN